MKLIVEQKDGRNVWHFVASENEALGLFRDYDDLLSKRLDIKRDVFEAGLLRFEQEFVTNLMGSYLKLHPFFACIWKELRNGHIQPPADQEEIKSHGAVKLPIET
ncbi:MAG TPA: hypothetical protein VIV60_30525 [Polyangiaceae bacterium]